MNKLAKAAKSIYSLFDPIKNFRTVVEAFEMIWRHRALCKEWVKRDTTSQYAGQALGSFWIIGHPMMMLGIYIFVFSVVLKVRIQTSVDLPRDYTAYLLAGLVPWLSLVQSLTRSPTALIGNVNMVKQVVFPIEVLPVSVTVISIIPLAIGIVLILLRTVFFEGALPITALLLPAAIAIHLTMMFGIAFFLSVITPFVRDTKEITIIFSIAGVYLIPAFFLPQWIPDAVRPLLYLNPFSYLVWMYQDVLYYGAIRNQFAWIVSFILAITFLALGYRAFRALKPYVADVL